MRSSSTTGFKDLPCLLSDAGATRYVQYLSSFLAVMALVVFRFLIFAPSADAAEKRFGGVEIVVGVMAAPAVGNPAKAHAKCWESATGGKVKIVEFPYDELFDQFKSALTSDKPSFDVIFYASQWGGDFFPYLAEMPSELASGESFDDILPIYLDRLMKWDGKTVSITIDGDLYNGYYRKDLFEDPVNQSEFKSRFSRELAPPDTWEEYRQIAQFFNGRKTANGQIVSGATEPFAPGTQQFWDVFSRAAAFTNSPDLPGAQFFDPDTMKAQINNEGWKRAVQDYVDIFHYCPQGSEHFGILDTREVFISGKAAMTLDWGDTGPLAADPKRSCVVDKVGYFVLPGTDTVWNYKKHTWEKQERPHKVPFLAFGGWVGGVPKNSRHKEAAWDFIVWFGNPENSLHDVVTSDTGINPYRYSHFMNIDAWTNLLSRQSASEYLDVIRVSLESRNIALDLRIPGFNEYTTAFEKQLFRAVKGEASVQEAMDEAAVEWEAITDRMGREKQRTLYRSSMGLAK